MRINIPFRHNFISAMRAVLAAALPCMVLAAPLAAEEWPLYRLDATIDPATHRLTTAADITLPKALAGQAIEFVLNADLTITAAEPAVERLPDDVGVRVFDGINGTSDELAARRGVAAYRVTLPAGSHGFRIEYNGTVDMPPETSPEEYARSFAETPGVIEERGTYLAGSTLWYPQLGGEHAAALVRFTLVVNTPPNWHLIAPGDGVSSGADGKARWASPAAVDEITLSGGPLTPYTARAGKVEAQVYLRQPDGALAARYLEATTRYLRMYDALIGPYPYQKFALVENFWETGYGMPSYTLLGPQIIRFPFILNSSYPHEILHNWWGNSVYVDYASGNWCEGLTAYLADHLMKEVEGSGAIYRRDTLKKYRDFAARSGDFPLREFRSRHNATTEAVGYGKTLMLFHMLRMQLGDERFREGLATFYRDYRGQRASFDDVRTVFERVGSVDLDRFFDQWVNRTGAADLVVEGVGVTGGPGRYTVSGTLRQRQDGPFAVGVPVVVTTARGAVTATIASDARRTPFRIETDEQPLSVTVDPAFDVFRVLDPRETAPSIGQLFGASEVVAVLPGGPAAETERWRQMLEAWKSPRNRITVVTDDEINALPNDRSVWLLGRNNRFATALFAREASLGLRVDDTGVHIGSKSWPFAGHSHVLTHRHPHDPHLAVGWVSSDPAAALVGLARKLPHYGKYSWLTFAGTEPANVGKGEWPTADSPLHVNLQGDGAPLVLATLPKRAALAEPPATWSPDRLRAHIDFLAAPEREGRGFGSQGLVQAGDYIAARFKAAGLRPATPDGSWFQPFDAPGGPDGNGATLRNVIGVLPGTDPRFNGEVAIISAHYDHLGFGWPGGRIDALGKMHPGADDNASGVAVLLEMAAQLAAGPPPPRSIVFIAFSGEEAGLVGSRHFVKHPVPVPLAGIVGVINMDTVGRLGDNPVSVIATESAREWPFVFNGITAVTGIATRSIPGASESSDQRAFIEAGVPGVQLFAGAGYDYHRPTDTPDKIDVEGMVRVATVASEAIGYLASTEKRPTANAPTPLTGPGPVAGGRSRRVSLGAVPSFGYPGPGLKLDGVVPGSPAEQAGLKTGDILTHVDDREVANLGGFNEILKTLEPGQKVTLRWLHDGTAATASVELVAR